MADLKEIYSRASSITPLDKNYRFKPKGQFYLWDPYMEEWTRGGDYTAFEVQTDIEEEDVNSNEYPERTLDFVDITKADITLSWTSKMLPDLLRRTAMLSKHMTKVQAAVEAAELNVSLSNGGVARVPHLAIEECDVTAAAADGELYIEGVHWRIDRVSGFLILLQHPAGVVLDAKGKAAVKITYSAAACERKQFGFMSQTSIMTKVAFRQKVKWGPQSLAIFNRVQARPEGAIPLGGDGDAFGEMGFQGRVFADPSQPADLQLGEAIDLPRDYEFDLAA